jgi:hypothetical protein
VIARESKMRPSPLAPGRVAICPGCPCGNKGGEKSTDKGA